VSQPKQRPGRDRAAVRQLGGDLNLDKETLKLDEETLNLDEEATTGHGDRVRERVGQ
jgi:hypothetical protein